MSLVTRYLEPDLVERLEQLQLWGRSIVECSTIGIHRSPIRGASIEFRQHRPYAVGDEPRRLDWRILARTDRTYVKEYEQESNLRCILILDCSGSMAYPREHGHERGGPRAQRRDTKFQYAAKVAAALSYLMLGQTESVGLATAEEQGRWLGPCAGTGQLARVIELLERSAPRGQANLPAAMQSAAERLGRRSMVVIVSDFFSPVPELRRGLARLRHGRHEIIALRVLDRDEQEFPFVGWCRFRGLEDEGAQLCEPALMKKMYLEAFTRHARELEQACGMLGAELYTLRTDRPLVDSLIGFLTHREAQLPAGRR
jgi:uncharacterized protein (DUF58 family)